jgi:Asp-tRNA(Asn)/Glu-tRNA(Gln) amidotransferase A subunit family amidase
VVPFTYPFNLTGRPAGSLPCGLSAEGLPIGLQVVAPLCGEARLVAAMRSAEAVLGPLCPTPIERRGMDAQSQLA